MHDLIIIGGGEHARVVIEAARAIPSKWNIIGFVDPLPCEETAARMHVPRLGGDDTLSRYPNAALVLGIGTTTLNDRRQRAVARIGATPERWAVIAHPGASISPTALVGPGSVVLSGAVVNTGARVGQHCILNTHTFLDHDVTIGAFVHTAPGSIVGGGAHVGDGSYLGMGSLIRDHRTLGRTCLVGMGAVVTADFGDDTTLIGVPARPRGGAR